MGRIVIAVPWCVWNWIRSYWRASLVRGFLRDYIGLAWDPDGVWTQRCDPAMHPVDGDANHAIADDDIASENLKNMLLCLLAKVVGFVVGFAFFVCSSSWLLARLLARALALVSKLVTTILRTIFCDFCFDWKPNAESKGELQSHSRRKGQTWAQKSYSK